MIDHRDDISVLTLPIYTSVYDLKKEKVWNGGLGRYSPELFTLGHNGKILHDDMTLAELATSGTELRLHIFSFDIFVRKWLTAIKDKVTLHTKDLRIPVNIVKGFLLASGKITVTNSIKICNRDLAEIKPNNNQYFIPGQTMCYLVS